MLFRQRRRGVIKAAPIDRAIPFCLRGKEMRCVSERLVLLNSKLSATGGDERVPAAERAVCTVNLQPYIAVV